MSLGLLPSTTEISTVFLDEIDHLGGKIIDLIEADDFLLQRATLPTLRNVSDDDTICGGIVLRTVGNDVRVHPYLPHHARGNGIILADVTQARRLRRAEFCDDPCIAEDVMLGLRVAIHDCSQSEILDATASRLREAASLEAGPDTLPHLLSQQIRLSELIDKQLIRLIITHFTVQEKPTLYGLVNAITLTARDDPDPCCRWALEELGGALLLSFLPIRPDISDAAKPHVTN